MPMNNIFTGKTGLISLFLPGTATPESTDAQTVLNDYDPAGGGSPPIGRATNIKVYVQTDLEEFHQIGVRWPQVLQPGNVHIGGEIERAYMHGGVLSLLLGKGVSATNAEPFVQPSFGIIVDLKDPAVPGNEAKLVLDGVKFENWSFSMPEDDFVMENVTFRAMTIHVIDSETPAGASAAVEHKPFG